MEKKRLIDIRRWNPTMDGYTSVIVRVGDAPGAALNGKMKANKARELEDEIDRLYKMESELCKWRSKIIEKHLTKSNGCEADEWPELTFDEMIPLVEEVFDILSEMESK